MPIVRVASDTNTVRRPVSPLTDVGVYGVVCSQRPTCSDVGMVLGLSQRGSSKLRRFLGFGRRLASKHRRAWLWYSLTSKNLTLSA